MTSEWRLPKTQKTFLGRRYQVAGIKDVAKKAGVSISTVSNVINGNRYVSEELKDRVHQAILDLNYEVNLVARSLKNNKTMTIGVVLTSMDRIFIPQVLSGMQHCAQKHKYSLSIYTTYDDIAKEKSYMKRLVNSQVDGIILDSVADIREEKYYQSLSHLKKGDVPIPVVSIERNLSKYSISSVYVDNLLGAYMATNHLIQSGCEKIVHITGPITIEMLEQRGRGYRKALNEAGMEFSREYEVYGDFSPLSGYRETKKLIQNGIIFDGIFADNDQMAIGAIKALKESGFQIPQKIKVAGFDNTFVSSIVKPALTTINVPKYRMGVEAMEILCQAIDGTEQMQPRHSFELPINLLVRESTTGESMENWDLEGW